ncbi:hypothetical protein, partial [Streptomyces sp. NPDC054863]
MSLLSLKTPLRHAVLAAVTAGAICLPATTAFADTTPKATPSTAERTATPSSAPSAPSASGGVSAGSGTGPAVTPPGGGETGPSVAPPRGGVAAGEQPEAAPAGSSTATVGAAAGA